MKRFKIILTSLIVASILQTGLVVGSIETSAANENIYEKSSVTASASGKAQKTIDIRIKAAPNSDIRKSVQQALDIARDLATDIMPYRIIIPAGTYKLSGPLQIYSNTQIYAAGAHIIKESLSGGMLRTAMPTKGKSHSGYNGYRNIKIEGGVWDGNSESKIYGEGKCNVFSSFRFAHATNIVLKSLSVTNNVGSHHLEIGGINRIEITGCTFQGYKNGGVSGGKEAIQLDVMYSEDVFVGYPSFDDTPCKNVKITNNKFINVNRGIGTHTAVMGVYFDNIDIYDNYFENINQQAILALNWRNCNISENTIKNAAAGVDFKCMEAGLYHNPKKGKANITSDFKTTITHNNISIRKNASNELSYVFGIRAWGAEVTSSSNPNNIKNGVYTVTDMTISNNSITSYGRIDAGISGRLMNNSTVCGNTINFANASGNKNSRGIYLKRSSNNLIEKNVCNKIVGTGGNGIHLVEGSNKNTIKLNTITACAGSGISINSSSSTNTIIGGSVKQNGNNGISFNSASNNTVSNVKDIASNKGYGIGISLSENNKISKVKVVTSGKSGIAVSNSQKNSITVSECLSNKGYGFSITGSSKNNSAFECSSDNNTKGQIEISSKSSKNTVSEFKTNTTAKGINPSVPQNVKVSARTSTTIKLQWSKCKNVSGYKIYRQQNGTGAYVRIKTIPNSSVTTYTDAGLNPNTQYSYRITSYYASNDNIIISSYQKNLTYRTLLKAPSSASAVPARTSVQLKWSKVTNANGYFVYKYNKKTGTYQKMLNIGGGNVLTIKNSGLTPNTEYKYKIIPYVKVGDSYITGESSKIIIVKTLK